MKELINHWVTQIPGVEGYEALLSTAFASTLVIILGGIIYFVAKRIIVHLIHKFVTRTESELDDVLMKHRLFDRLAILAPGWIVYKLMPLVLSDYATIAAITSTIIAIYLVVVITLIADAVIDSALEIYHSFPVSRQVPIQNFGQVAKLLTYFVSLIVIASLIIGESPLKLFAGLGAMTAVLMLIFKDPILGFVAGLQLSYNKMVQLGDWVEIPQHKADGDILEIGLTTVKVQNFDKTITTVPTHSLISESFKNWRGMQESPGRRIKRSIYIDVNSIGFCDDERVERYRKIDLIKDYIDAKTTELNNYNASVVGNPDSIVNGRRITNIGTFRAYVLAYLKSHPMINQELTVLVRQLAPSEAGLPLQIYAFSAEKDWGKYEAIQSDIFDHLLAVAREFDLRVFQKPSGLDFQRLVG